MMGGMGWACGGRVVLPSYTQVCPYCSRFYGIIPLEEVLPPISPPPPQPPPRPKKKISISHPQHPNLSPPASPPTN